jgi:hypothetical protein
MLTIILPGILHAAQPFDVRERRMPGATGSFVCASMK